MAEQEAKEVASSGSDDKKDTPQVVDVEDEAQSEEEHEEEEEGKHLHTCAPQAQMQQSRDFAGLTISFCNTTTSIPKQFPSQSPSRYPETYLFSVVNREYLSQVVFVVDESVH